MISWPCSSFAHPVDEINDQCHGRQDKRCQVRELSEAGDAGLPVTARNKVQNWDVLYYD
jgi:hypothetical protein